MSVRTHEVKGPFYTAAIVRYAPQSAMPPHAHELADVTVVLAGSLVEDAGVVRVEADAGSTMLSPRQKVHANRFGASGAALLNITLDHDQELVADTALDEWRWGRTLDVYREALRLASVLCDGATATPGDATLDDLVTDLIAAADAAMNTPSARGSPPWLRNIKSLLDANSAAAPSVSELARSAGVHPVYLARRFRQTYGCSVALPASRADACGSPSPHVGPRHRLAHRGRTGIRGPQSPRSRMQDCTRSQPLHDQSPPMAIAGSSLAAWLGLF